MNFDNGINLAIAWDRVRATDSFNTVIARPPAEATDSTEPVIRSEIAACESFV